MKKKIDWILKIDSHIISMHKGVICDFIPEKEIVFIEENAKNKIDLENHIYERTADDYTMSIDFKKKICSFVFSTNERCSFDIKANFKESENNLVLTYSLDTEEDEKEIYVSW